MKFSGRILLICQDEPRLSLRAGPVASGENKFAGKISSQLTLGTLGCKRRILSPVGHHWGANLGPISPAAIWWAIQWAQWGGGRHFQANRAIDRAPSGAPEIVIQT